MKCRVCGCTDENACPEGCGWVEDRLCSSCGTVVEFEPDDYPAAIFFRVLNALDELSMVSDDAGVVKITFEDEFRGKKCVSRRLVVERIPT